MPPTICGYARVSTDDQNLDMQMRALKAAGCDVIYSEKVSAASVSRTQFKQMMRSLRRGDTLVVWKLDRLGRDLMQVIKLGQKLETDGIELRSLTESIDTTTAMGKFFFQMLGVFAELERNITIERTRAGLAAAKERGMKLGRPTDIIGARKASILKDLHDVTIPVNEVAAKYGVTRTTLAKHFPRARSIALAKMGR